jgi:hypothetical protein
MTSLRNQNRTEFPARVKADAFRRCCDDKGVPHCESCSNKLTGAGTIFEHVTPDGLGGEPTLDNCKVHCKTCAATKTFDEDNPRMQKADRQLKKAYGIKPKGRPIPGSKASGVRKRMNGNVEAW